MRGSRFESGLTRHARRGCEGVLTTPPQSQGSTQLPSPCGLGERAKRACGRVIECELGFRDRGLDGIHLLRGCLVIVMVAARKEASVERRAQAR